jgi:hypothetical protein
MILGINDTLLNHLATSAGPASIIRNACPGITDLAAAFFRTRTDIKRLSAAQDVANAILENNDLRDLMAIRDIVARQELRRQIKYGKQQDHTAHTVCLYFLGLWLHDNVSAIAKAVKNQYRRSQTTGGADEYFLLQWAYASLLHDVGYAFHSLAPETLPDRKRLDGVFSWEWIPQQYRAPLSRRAKTALKNAFADWQAKYKMPSGIAAYADGRFVEVMNRLAYAPWVADLAPQLAGKDVFEILDPGTGFLRAYALEVATSGYGGAGHCVDHAVASGLFLFQYTSYWYWLMWRAREIDPSVYEKVTESFDYSPRNLVTDFVSACRAVAFHNVQPSVGAAAAIIPRIRLDREPITFLAVLCDELQRWDRAPAGSTHLDSYRVFAEAALESSDVQILAEGSRTDSRARFLVRAPATPRSEEDLLKAFTTALATRLPRYSDVLDIEVLNR